MSQENIMRAFEIKKIILSSGATEVGLEKAHKLLEIISKRKAQIIKSGPRRRIPAFGVKPNMPLGTSVTVRGKEGLELLKRFLGAIDNQLKESQVDENTFSFGIKEYIDIPDMEYIREIGIRGFNVSVVFERKGLRVKKRKIKRGKIPKKQNITKEEIISFMKGI
jgi:large subunit ribosomal protein L5